MRRPCPAAATPRTCRLSLRLAAREPAPAVLENESGGKTLRPIHVAPWRGVMSDGRRRPSGARHLWPATCCTPLRDHDTTFNSLAEPCGFVSSRSEHPQERITGEEIDHVHS